MSVEKEAKALRVIRGAGIEARSVRSIGVNGEIAAISASPEVADRLTALTTELRGLGYRYVALALDAPADT